MGVDRTVAAHGTRSWDEELRDGHRGVARPLLGRRPFAAPHVAAGGDLGWALPGAVVGAVVMYIAHRGLIDDAYISLNFVRNLAAHLHWGLIPTETANTATSPLNIILLAVVTRLVGLVTGDLRPVVALGVVTVALSAAMTVWAARIARRIGIPGAWSLAVLALVFANPFLNSALGLEVLLVAALLVGLTAQAVRGSRVGFGVLAGLVVLARLDVGLAVAAVYLLTPALRRRPWVAPLTGAAVALPWFVFSWIALGSAIPASFVIKTLRDRVARIGVAGVGGHRRHNRLDKASGVAHKDRAGVGRDRDHGRRRMALALAVGEVTAWASGPAPARQARCVCAS